jgi:biotin operon repressor
MPKSVTREIRLWKQRHAMAATIIRLMEGFRDDYLPGLRTWDAFAPLLILRKMGEMHDAGHAASASALSRSTGMPRTTVQRKLAQLKKIGAIDQHGSLFLMLPPYLNKPAILQGFRRRRDMVGRLPKKLSETGS